MHSVHIFMDNDVEGITAGTTELYISFSKTPSKGEDQQVHRCYSMGHFNRVYEPLATGLYSALASGLNHLLCHLCHDEALEGKCSGVNDRMREVIGEEIL